MTSGSSHKGFTIVETLVAITVLMIAIAGPLSIASKGLNGALASRDQMIASYLAQESVEVIKNIRDNNIEAGIDWNTGFSSCDNTASSRHCDASAVDAPSVAASGAAAYRMYMNSGYYSHVNSGTPTPFTRYFYLSRPGTSLGCSPADAECTLTVVVDWYEGSVPYQVITSNEIVNSPR